MQSSCNSTVPARTDANVYVDIHVAVEFTTHTIILCIFPCATFPPQILIAVSYFIASGFMSVFHMAVDTIFICACELICPAAVYSCHNNYSYWRICRCVSVLLLLKKRNSLTIAPMSLKFCV